jgi:Gpi18-like mannosyltransferase
MKIEFKAKDLINNGMFFALAMWLFSRVIVFTCILLIAPALSHPTNNIPATASWQLFSLGDAKFYHKIAVSGYEYADDNHEHNVAFFPLLPLIVRGVMMTGLSWEVAGVLVTNLAFLIALIILYDWTCKSYGVNVARCSTAVLACFPMTLFCTVIYSESLFLLFSTATLRAFEQRKYGWTSLWGAIATASRPTGTALIAALLITSIKERRGIKAYFASLASCGGIISFSLYCQAKFGDALAFLHAEKAWRPSPGIDWRGWSEMLLKIIIGGKNQVSGYLRDPWYPLAIVILIICCYLLWYFLRRLGSHITDYGFFAIILCLWLLAGDPLINASTVLGGAYLIWCVRNQITYITMMYGFCGIGLILASGGVMSISRIGYGIVSLSIALGVLLSHYPRWRYAAIFFFTILTASLSIRFSQSYFNTRVQI